MRNRGGSGIAADTAMKKQHVVTGQAKITSIRDNHVSSDNADVAITTKGATATKPTSKPTSSVNRGITGIAVDTTTIGKRKTSGITADATTRQVVEDGNYKFIDSNALGKKKS